MQEPLPTGLDQAVVGITTGWFAMQRVGDEGAALLQAGEQTGHALAVPQASIVRLDQFLFAHAARRGQHRDVALAGDPPHPGLVRVGALFKD